MWLLKRMEEVSSCCQPLVKPLRDIQTLGPHFRTASTCDDPNGSSLHLSRRVSPALTCLKYTRAAYTTTYSTTYETSTRCRQQFPTESQFHEK
jgi:hypothetical protein